MVRNTLLSFLSLHSPERDKASVPLKPGFVLIALLEASRGWRAVWAGQSRPRRQMGGQTLGAERGKVSLELTTRQPWGCGRAT